MNNNWQYSSSLGWDMIENLDDHRIPQYTHRYKRTSNKRYAEYHDRNKDTILTPSLIFVVQSKPWI